MSKVKFYAPVQEMNGELEKGSGIILRKKKFRAPNGTVLREGVQESYRITNPRDFKKKPQKNKELLNTQIFAESKRRSSEIIRAGKYTDEEISAMTQEEQAHVAELQQLLEQYRTRFYTQFKQPDPEAPFEKMLRPGSTKLKRKQYSKIDNFIQAIIRQHLTNPQP